MKKFTIPHTYVLLFFVIVVAVVMTYIVPAGQFDRAEDPDTGRIFVVTDSFEYVEQSPVSPFGLFQAIPKGMVQASMIIFFVLMIGGAFGIIQSTGTIDAGIGTVVKTMAGREKLIIPIVMFIFSLAGAMLGIAEEVLPFYPIMIALAIALGFDSITGTAMILLGAGAGFAGAFANPFTVGIAQGISGLPLFSGLAFRIVAYVLILGSSIIYVYRYATKIQGNPELSATREEDQNRSYQLDLNDLQEMTGKHKAVMAVLGVGMILLALGVGLWGFYINELTALFLVMGITAGLVGGLSMNGIAEEFIKGAQDLVYGALIIGLATSIMVVMQEGNILDTVIYSLANLVQGLPTVLSAIGMFFVQTLINIFVPSGSGQAAVSMPIMAPMADVVGITRQTAVLAFQFGDGFTNVISPTSGYFMAALAIGGIRWEKWAKWMFPLFLIWSAIGIVLISIAVLIDYGPF
ncbi:C4-dicarboxylate anaerobic carrier [Alkaliphilus metalliredigens QYMF]|uniref:C4-dicarboxylate anaerobic carrier n=1 Tax=Alkaliphilus metalliredigens (strain QYMF) TaxID=293826 RepID=A6TL18_ALKMQ|nr:AbgT family transporter [Alkaliphilus metalliredigens]ABR46886.1 C4-dicarboxylate anaerobic carrier [Alkaliphilus metalliredigens QYMF]